MLLWWLFPVRISGSKRQRDGLGGISQNKLRRLPELQLS
jgi:hypothetical protein